MNYTEDVNAGRIEEMERIKKVMESEEPESNEDYREPLSIDTETVKKILLSWGGPEDGFKLYFSAEKELLRGVYYRADWGEYKESDLSDDEAQTVYDYYLGGYFE
jgi:hypothetical protein